MRADGGTEVLVSGPDFVSDPRLAPDGVTLSWLQWDHPNMPWDAAQLVVRAADGTEHVLAGGPGESVVQPVWGGTSSLWFFSDRTDFWSLYRKRPHEERRARRGRRRRHRRPAVGVRAEPVRAPRRRPGRVRLRPRRRRSARRPRAPTAACASSTCRSAPSGASPRRGRRSSAWRAARRASPWSCGWMSTAASRRSSARRATSAWTRPGSPGRSTYLPDRRAHRDRRRHALVYPPTNPESGRRRRAAAPDGAWSTAVPRPRPARCQPRRAVLDARGFAVADVDYRGSPATAARYRDALQGRWGSSTSTTSSPRPLLADAGRVDPARWRSAAAARAATPRWPRSRRDVFAAGASHYGVADLGDARPRRTSSSRATSRTGRPVSGGRGRLARALADQPRRALRHPAVRVPGRRGQVVPPEPGGDIVEALRGGRARRVPALRRRAARFP